MQLQVAMAHCFLFVSLTASGQPYNSPYEIPKFQAFIAGCKLQAPTSATAATAEELMSGYTSDNFYVVEDDKIAFNQSGELMRTEFRHETNWSLGNRSFHGRLKFVLQTTNQVTVVQIHDDANAGNGPNKPLLRIYKHLTKSPANHLWAAIKTDIGGDNTTHVDLGLAPSGYFDWDVILEDGSMIINIDGVEKVDLNVSFWTFPSYWKAGVYLQDDGEATVYFDELYLEGEDEQPVLSTESELTEEIRVYPNPADTFITVDLESPDFLHGTIRVMDVSGKIRHVAIITMQKVNLPIDGEAGIYHVLVEKGDLRRTLRIIKE